MTEPPSNITRLPVQPSRRIVLRRPLVERVRGIASDLREVITDHAINRDELRAIVQRLDMLARELEGDAT
ncbi:hypothetical protein JHL17_11275 [Azospirillum sp. YIM B02556]|uniref:MarR family transcriptional regulator n=1 Tax=Azospirillum endophyticum TaxID=2800326 RepID=A0ABS1F3R1_9PROT|nr:hypothetical protein [Azospirillum endophyticum]MBK1837994.1 hypothetical protein [Azospirillum endophyticum]